MAEVTREEADGWTGTTILEFGASWCGICQGARSLIDRALAARPDARHVWIEDGKGRVLGRTFRVKLWPTLIVLRDGVEVARVVRPRSERELREAFDRAPPTPA